MSKRKVIMLVVTVLFAIAFMASSVMASDKDMLKSAATKTFKPASEHIMLAFLTEGGAGMPGSGATTINYDSTYWQTYTPGTGNTGPGTRTQK